MSVKSKNSWNYFASAIYLREILRARNSYLVNFDPLHLPIFAHALNVYIIIRGVKKLRVAALILGREMIPNNEE